VTANPALRERLVYDTPLWAKHCATILNEHRQPVKVTPRPWQARTPQTPAHITPLDEALERQRAAGMPMRALILKARKLGFSTWVQLKFMQRVSQLPFQYALSIAHTRKTASVLYDMAELIYERLPTEEQLGLGFNIRPQMIGQGRTRDGARWMSLGSKRNPVEASVYETLTAGSSSGIGRGYTPNLFHGSEAAHYPDPMHLAGALNSVPKVPETIVILESTANGFNHFYDRWVAAVEGEEDEFGGLFVPLFYGWQDNPFNALPFTSDEARARFENTIGDIDGGGDEEEIQLVEQFHVTAEQLFWRRVTKREDCGGSLEIFHQEHPATPEEAFIGSGDPVFPGILVSKAISRCKASHEPVTGIIGVEKWRERKTRKGTIKVPQSVIWIPSHAVEGEDRELWGSSPAGHLHVWEHPVNEFTQQEIAEEKREPDAQYVNFTDVAQGEGSTTEVRDYSAIQIVDHLSKLQVARWRGRPSLHDLPLITLLIGIYYNLAWIAPEKTGLGIAVVDSLQKDYKYPRIYRTRRRGDDQRTDQDQRLLGWSTNPQTKPLMEMTFGELLKEEVDGLRDIATAREFTTYVEIDRGKHGAQAGAYDDLAMSYMGAQRVALELKPRAPGERKKSVRGFTVGDEIG
jgi:hypothetical protein